MRLAVAALVSTLALAAACAAAVATSAAPSTSTAPRHEPILPVQAEDTYYKSAAEAVDIRIAERGIKPAKNVILFVGDGMGVSTITASRIYAGQSAGVDGESFRLAMESLPWSALSKTYSHDYQVSDSAATATAMTAGLKTKSGFLGVSSAANFGNCASAQGTEADTLFEIAQRAGLATGVISTARITHATPGATYAKVPHRNWEADADMRGASSDTCKDIARQLIEGPSSDFDVILGGGRAKFLPAETPDPEYPDQTGERADGRNLMEEWAAKDGTRKTVFDRAGFAAIDFASDVKVFGLFEPSHMQYELDREADTAGEPSLEEMTRAAITRLSRNEDGFVLMVEGGRIDHAHHAGNAIRALEDTLAFDAAIAAALEMTNAEDTLIIVTADHSHSLTINGYPQRGNPILGLVTAGASSEGGSLGADGLPYTTLSYANGPGACRETDKDAEGKPEYDCKRYDLTGIDTGAPDFRQQSLVPLYSETHGGEDVAAFASGPGANLISGVIEQNEIFHVMGRAVGLIPAPAAEE
ncbi:alkaline phosphatase [Hyphomonas neptunium ATCC 15444]|uniref:Alkaline phosphatase n=2 Tax=Hyphomonas TaxID=85 RepID=Q0BWI9_HYPNA|nr:MULTISPECIES: alkaline phosphatase [Hyphomonas]ABI78047.1 alkaline phosphatase [Hyphomonas neptunium ATCC 15444]KCZ94730.1 alkaline phosphatase [Hyphomonas hirschiana VP5]